MKKPYIRKLEEVAGFVVWIVNGYWIRRNLEDDFTNYAQHYQFNFIPKKEFWIDIESSKRKESKYYIQSMLIMNKLMAEGISRKKAIKIANEMEEIERKKSKIVQRLGKEKEDQLNTIKKVHKKFLKRLSFNGIKVWLVKGDLVRALFYPDFTQGGHEFVYSFIPPGEVWLDDDLYKKEIPFVLIHELHERRLMSQGDKYDPSHEESNKIEYSCRQNPKEIEKQLKTELILNKR